jgi:toxin ParE1/3/4
VAKPVRLRRAAADDIDAALDFYLAQAGLDVARRFIDAVELTLHRIGRHPHRGSLRFAYELNIPELRVWSLTRFPYVVCYAERESEVDVWRLLHTRRDIPAILAADSNDEA